MDVHPNYPRKAVDDRDERQKHNESDKLIDMSVHVVENSDHRMIFANRYLRYNSARAILD